MRNLIQFSLVLCVVGLSVTQALAFNGIGSDWRAYYSDTCPELQAATTNATGCVLCHINGFNLNSYGDDVANANNDFASIEGDDSDGDGRTNGEEILIDCTLPGDAASPVDPSTWGNIKVLFR